MEPTLHSKRKFLFDTWMFYFLVAPNDNRNDNGTITKNSVLGLGKAETGFKMSFVNGHSTLSNPEMLFTL
jgi:hypothetical protein